MRIIVVSEAATISGGAEKVALTSAVALAKCGIPTTVFAGTGPIDIRLQDIPHLTVHCTGQRPYYENSDAVLPIRQTLWNADAAMAFRSVLAIHDPSETVVHFHSYLRVHSGAVMAAALDLGFPSIITLHDYALACPSMGFYNFKRQEICPLTPLSPRCFGTNCTARGYGNKLGLLARSSLLATKVRWRARIHRFIAVSAISGEIMRPYLGPGAAIDLVLNPVDVEPGPAVDVRNNSRLLYVGRLEPHKDPLRLADAARTVGLPVMFVGDGPLRTEVEAANPDAIVTGWVTPAEVNRAMRQARALVMTSRWYEAAPLVIFDALAAGLPVVVPDTCAGREFVDDGKTGFVYESCNPTGLETALELLKNDELVAELGRTAHARLWASPPTMERHVEQLIEVYGEVLRPHIVPGMAI